MTTTDRIIEAIDTCAAEALLCGVATAATFELTEEDLEWIAGELGDVPSSEDLRHAMWCWRNL